MVGDKGKVMTIEVMMELPSTHRLSAVIWKCMGKYGTNTISGGVHHHGYWQSQIVVSEDLGRCKLVLALLKRLGTLGRPFLFLTACRRAFQGCSRVARFGINFP